IVLHKHKTSTTQRKPKPRIIPLVPVVVKLLVWLRRHPVYVLMEPETIFVNSRGTPWNYLTLSNQMQRLRKKAGLPADAKLYGVRHRWATQAAVNGVALKTL